MGISRLVSDVWRDVRYGARVLVRNPLFSTVAIASLTIGIGGATSVFTVMNAVLLRGLPVPNPGQLFELQKVSGPDQPGRQFAWPVFELARNELQGRAELCAFIYATGMQVRPDAASGSAAERGMVQLVSGEYFTVLRQRPQVGRLLQPSDNVTIDGHPVAVISDAFWARHYNRSATAVGRQMIVNGATLTIVGVAAPEFFGPIVSFRNPEIWVPLMMQPSIRYASNASTSDAAEPLKPWPPQAAIEWLTILSRVPDAGAVPEVAAALTVLHQREAMSRLASGTDEDRATVPGSASCSRPRPAASRRCARISDGR